MNSFSLREFFLSESGYVETRKAMPLGAAAILALGLFALVATPEPAAACSSCFGGGGLRMDYIGSGASFGCHISGHNHLHAAWTSSCQFVGNGCYNQIWCNN